MAVLARSLPIGTRVVKAAAATPGIAATLVSTACCMRVTPSGAATMLGGIEMLIAQAERQFELWTGEKPPTGLFESVVTPVRLKPDSTLV